MRLLRILPASNRQESRARQTSRGLECLLPGKKSEAQSAIQQEARVGAGLSAAPGARSSELPCGAQSAWQGASADVTRPARGSLHQGRRLARRRAGLRAVPASGLVAVPIGMVSILARTQNGFAP